MATPASKVLARAPSGEQIDQGAEPRQKTVVEHFRRDWSASQIQRDLKDLRDHNLIRTSRRGIYERIEKETTHAP